MQLPQDCGNSANCFLILLSIGVLIGLGKTLDGEHKVTLRTAVGRALMTGGLSVAAGAILMFIPALPPLAILGLGAALASLGTSFLERILINFLKVKNG